MVTLRKDTGVHLTERARSFHLTWRMCGENSLVCVWVWRTSITCQDWVFESRGCWEALLEAFKMKCLNRRTISIYGKIKTRGYRFKIIAKESLESWAEILKKSTVFNNLEYKQNMLETLITSDCIGGRRNRANISVEYTLSILGMGGNSHSIKPQGRCWIDSKRYPLERTKEMPVIGWDQCRMGINCK